MKLKKTKKPLIIFLAVVLAVVLIFSSVSVLFYVMSRQGKAVIIDKTAPSAQADSSTPSGDTNDPSNGADLPVEDNGTYVSEIIDKLESSGDDSDAIVLTSGVSLFTDECSEEINDSVLKISKLASGIRLDIEDGTEFEELGVGDIFFLDGNEDTPFSEPYIGKISSVDDREEVNSYVIETPMFDEVFDVLKIDMDETLTADDITSIQAMPGVNINYINTGDDSDTSGEAAPLSASGDSFTVSKLGDIGSAENEFCDNDKDVDLNLDLDDESIEGEVEIGPGGIGVKVEDKGVYITFDVDLLEAFGKKSDDSVEYQEVYDEASNHDTVLVYTTKTGTCYHRESCMCVSRSKIEMKLKEAVDEGFDVCFLCNPPLYKENGKTNKDQELKLTGSFGFDNLDVVTVFDWDILSGKGFENVSFDITGDFVVDVDLKYNNKFEFGPTATGFTSPYNVLSAKGLDQKVFPLLFISYNGVFNAPIYGKGVNDKITAVTAPAPLTVGVIVYMDLSGNITFSSTLSFDYERSFSAGMTIFEKGEFVPDLHVDLSEGNPEVKFEAELKGDADAHFGCSVNLYIFNINPLEIGIVKFGTEAEGALKLAFPDDDGGLPFSGSYNVRLYLKLISVDLNIKTKLDVGPLDLDMSLKGDWLWKDITLKQWGSKNPTRYSEDTMSYSHITAKDSEAVYYKDTDGALVRETSGERKKIYTDGFYTICGIDATYVYLLQNDTETGNYEIRRVKKTDGAINKVIADDVVNCLTIDESNIYYVDSFNRTQIMKLDRNTLESEMFCNFSSNVVYMVKQDDGFYTMRESSSFSSWFGGGPICMLLNEKGEVVEDYGEYPSVAEYNLSKFDKYIYAVRLVSSGYLRNSASEVRWANHDISSSIVINCASGTGWNPTEAGIFTVENNSNSDDPYKIVLYSAEDGSKSDVTTVSNSQSFFTLCQSDTGEWYFFDQTETDLNLYRMSEDFSTKNIVKTFDLATMNVNLSDCATQLVNNRLYFYTMPSEGECTPASIPSCT